MNRTMSGAWRQADALLPLLTGTALVAYGISRRSPTGAALAVLGGGMLYTGSRRAAGRERVHEGVRVEKSVTVERSADELFDFWRDFERLPRIMRHLKSVERIGENTWRWTAAAPAGQTISWEAEITAEMPGRMIAWRSLDGSTVWHEGSVEFFRATGGRGTVVDVSLRYDPPAGAFGRAMAKLFREEPSQQIAEDLRRFKQLMETGEIATTEGQPSGRE